jgi:hypothetical protein
MKTFYFLIVLLLTAAMAQAQLKDTKWEGKLNVPNETNVILDFKKDSVDMIIADEGIVGETMIYSVKDSIITMKKTSGHSPCNVDDVFKLKYRIKEDKLFLSNLSDPCDARIDAWSSEPLRRIQQ